jgi:hypothetical protein
MINYKTHVNTEGKLMARLLEFHRQHISAPLPHARLYHMVVELESFHGCLLALCTTPPSSLATEDDPSYTIFLFIIFFILSVQEILRLTNVVFK